MRIEIFVGLVTGLLSTQPAAALAQAGGRGLPTLAPYADIVWGSSTDAPRVLVKGQWFELLSIDGAPVAEIVAAARSGFGDEWQRRFDEDLIEVMSRLGHTAGATATLTLRDPGTGQTSTQPGVPMTSENRQSIIGARRARDLIGAPLSQAALLSPLSLVVGSIWLRDSANGALERITPTLPGRGSSAPSMSADGRVVVFHSDGDFLGEGLPRGTSELWKYDVSSRRLSRLTRASAAGRNSLNPSISADGSLIAFESDSDFLGQGVRAGQREIWVYDMRSAAIRRITTSTRAPSASATPVISADGSRIAFTSSVDLSEGSTPTPSLEVWLADVASGALTRVTRSPIAQRRSQRPALDATGTRVAFESDAFSSGDAGTAPGQMDIWLYDARSAALTKITNGGDPLRASEAPSMSADGNRIVFHSDADLLRDGHPDSVDEIWLYDVRSSVLQRLTHTWVPDRDAGKDAVLHPDAQYPKITPDGAKVVFAGDGDYLSEGVANGYPHLWIYDIATQRLVRADARASGSGVATDAAASRMALFRTDFDQIRNQRVAGPASSAPVVQRPTTLTAEQLNRDLDALQSDIEGRWAYLRANNVDYRAAIAAVRARGANGMSYSDYGLEVLKIISRFIDGHAGVGGVTFPAGNLPFLIESTADRFIAVRNDRSAFVDEQRPFITHIDGRPIEQWLEAASTYVSDASPQWTRRNALGVVRRVQFMRREMGLPVSDSVVIRFASDGGPARDVRVAVQMTSAPTAAQPRRASGLLDGNVGYLRLEIMDEAAVGEVMTWMPRFRDTRALIVDVRGNGGGTRDALRALFPFLMSPADAPRVVNAAKYKLHPDHREDHLGGSRYMYRESDPIWSAEERSAIARFKQTFQPEWTPPESEFSDWHYLVMSRGMNPAAFFYDRPVIVLLDQGSFSATDIFVSALKGWRNVRLVGTPSGGGSARQAAKALPSGISLNLATMASFQWTGRLYDGNGTQPDVLVQPDPGSFLRGGRDNILERAIELLRPTP